MATCHIRRSKYTAPPRYWPETADPGGASVGEHVAAVGAFGLAEEGESAEHVVDLALGAPSLREAAGEGRGGDRRVGLGIRKRD